MGIKLGSSDIADLKLGSAQVDRLYLGVNLVWENIVPLVAGVSPTSVTGFSSTTVVTSNATTVSTTGGDGSTITYNWRRVSGATNVSPTSSTGASTSFSAALMPTTTVNASFVCDVTQGGVIVDTTNPVAVELTRS